MPKTSYTPTKILLRARDFAHRLSVSESAVYHGVGELARLTPVRIGKSVRYALEEVEQLERELIQKARRRRAKWS